MSKIGDVKHVMRRVARKAAQTPRNHPEFQARRAKVIEAQKRKDRILKKFENKTAAA